MIEFKLPWPPSVNKYLGHRVMTPHGGKPIVSAYVTKEGVTFRGDAQAAVIHKLGRMPEPLEGRLTVSIVLHGPTRRVFDVDNFSKCVLDALTSCKVWLDDSQIDDLRVTRGAKKSGGCVLVSIEETRQPEPKLF